MWAALAFYKRETGRVRKASNFGEEGTRIVVFIDDCAHAFYNKRMETNQTTILYTEVAEPRRAVIKSDVVLWLVVVLGLFLLVFIGSFFSVALGVADGIVQLVTYFLLLGESYLLYRMRLISYRYALTERMLSVARILGRKERAEASLHLSDIARIRSGAELSRGQGGKWVRLYHGKRSETVALTYNIAGEERTMFLSLSDSMRKKLVEQWKVARRS